MVAAVISIIVNMITEEDHRSIAWIEGFAILVAVFVSSFVQAINNYQKERQFQKLNEAAESRKMIKIIRDGQEQEMRMTECLVGDLVVIQGGDEIAADGVIVSAFSVGCDESAMTGETELMEKSNLQECIRKRDDIRSSGEHGHIHEVPSPILVSGTMFKQGSGLMIITCVGESSAIGRIKKTVDENNDDDETPLQKKLTKIAEDIGKLGLVCAILTAIIMIVRCIIKYATEKRGWQSEHTSLIVQAFLIGITVLVVAIPEGLPLAVTLSLAYSVKQMLADQNLVRKLHACETMGGADIICSDKTGTLTMNKMFLTDFWNIESMRIYDPLIDFRKYVAPNCHQVFEQALTCNSLDDPTKETGNPTDMAILKYMLECNSNAMEVRQRYHKIFMEPFTSDRKRMSTLIEDKHHGRNVYLLKGASELIAKSCQNVLNLRTGQQLPINEQMRANIDQSIYSFAKQSLRTIGLAYKFVQTIDTHTKNNKGVLKEEESGFTLIGIAGIKDVIRPEVPDAVAVCHRAGITVKMVTGDNLVTARAIAKECNIIHPDEPDDDSNGRVMEGPEFYRLIGGVSKEEAAKEGDPPVEKIINGENFDRIYRKLAVLARSRPEDKYAMVTGLKERGHIVAVTGDGTNDAPALSKANVGFAMGITGTAVAKQAAAIMLMDDNFTSIVKAVKWGRNIYDSIRKFLQFQLTVNVVAVIITFISAAVTQEAILSSVQMLWVNMIMDTLASLALATETPSEELLLRQPTRPEDYIVSKKMAKHIIGQAILQIGVMMLFLFVGPSFLPDEIEDQNSPWVQPCKTTSDMCVRSGLISVLPEAERWPKPNDKQPSRHYTYNFNVFVVMQIFNFVNARKINDELNIFSRITSSMFFPVIVLIILLLQILIMLFGNIAFRLADWVNYANSRASESRDGSFASGLALSAGFGAYSSR